MTVGELIIALGALDPKLPVYVRGYEAGVNDVEEITLVQVSRDVNTEWYYGQHERDYDDNTTPGVELGGSNKRSQP